MAGAPKHVLNARTKLFNKQSPNTCQALGLELMGFQTRVTTALDLTCVLAGWGDDEANLCPLGCADPPSGLCRDQRRAHTAARVGWKLQTPQRTCTHTPRPPVRAGNKQVAALAAQADLFPLSSKEFINFSSFMWNLQSLLEGISIATW